MSGATTGSTFTLARRRSGRDAAIPVVRGSIPARPAAPRRRSASRQDLAMMLRLSPYASWAGCREALGSRHPVDRAPNHMHPAHWGGIAAVGILYAIFLAVGWAASRRARQARRRVARGRPRPALLDGHAHDGRHLDRRRLPVGHGRRSFRQPGLGMAGRRLFWLEPRLGGHRLRRQDAAAAFRHARRSAGGAVRRSLERRALSCRPGRRSLLERRAAGRDRRHLRRRCSTSTSPPRFSSPPPSSRSTPCWGGMWSVGYTDTVQFALIPIGMFLVLPLALRAVGGLDACWRELCGGDGVRGRASCRPLTADGYWTPPRIVNWWDLSLMLILGGIPWNCYFQRIQSCRTPARPAGIRSSPDCSPWG